MVMMMMMIIAALYQGPAPASLCVMLWGKPLVTVVKAHR